MISITAIKKHDYSDRDPLTYMIMKACYKVHSSLGPGFVEKIYVSGLKTALNKAGLKYHEEKEFNVVFDNEKIGKFRVDLLVEDKVIVEIKAIAGRIPKIFESQLISYLKSANLKTGLLINFGNRSCEIRRLMI